GVREVPPGRGPDDHDHRRHGPRALHRPGAGQGHGRRDRGDQRPPPGLTLPPPPAAPPPPPPLPIAPLAEAAEDPPSGRDRPDDGPPPVIRARRAADPLC